jgi:hypothetical protein
VDRDEASPQRRKAGAQVKNPWLAKNPFLSMWMSAGNTMLGAARGHALNYTRRHEAAAASAAQRAVLAFWFGKPLPKSTRKRRAKRR